MFNISTTASKQNFKSFKFLRNKCKFIYHAFVLGFLKDKYNGFILYLLKCVCLCFEMCFYLNTITLIFNAPKLYYGFTHFKNKII